MKCVLSSIVRLRSDDEKTETYHSSLPNGYGFIFISFIDRRNREKKTHLTWLYARNIPCGFEKSSAGAKLVRIRKP
jgi:hypothetical protein